jgi:hypothetical protein
VKEQRKIDPKDREAAEYAERFVREGIDGYNRRRNREWLAAASIVVFILIVIAVLIF